jgi:hypothetical protein
MPFKSQAQQKWMYANHPEMAQEWQSHTKGTLPKKVKKNDKKTSNKRKKH